MRDLPEADVGGVEEGVHGRETCKKSIVVIALEILAPKGFGRVRLRRGPDVSGLRLIGFVRDAVEPGFVKFKLGPLQLLVAYEFNERRNVVELLDVGPRENFYRDLENYRADR